MEIINSQVWITADWHFGETRFDLMGRPFSSQDEHVNHLIRNINSRVLPDDYLYVLGDICYQKTPEFLSCVSQVNGKKILVRGNHDRVFTDEELSAYFEKIYPEGSGIEAELCGIPCYMTHYPSCGVKSRFNLVGHIHSAWKYQLNMLNVGVDVNHFFPINVSSIGFHLNAITNFYDNDVWIAYNDVNHSYANVRGVKKNYFVKN